MKQNSEIIDFFPINFNIDLEGKKEDYLGVVCFPFVDIKRLKDAVFKDRFIEINRI